MRWHDAAARASFLFYEPDNVNDRWAGGFAFDGTLIEVIGALDGNEVSVETSRPERARPDNLHRRAAITELLWRYVMDDADELALPYSVTIEADDRAVTVDSETYTVHGMRVQGDSRWVGTMGLGDVTVKISTASRTALSFRVCTDPALLPEIPPTAG